MLSMPCKEKARDTMPLKFCAPGFHSNATEVQATPPGGVQPCQNGGESSGRSHHVVPVGAYARAHWPVRGRCKLRQRPATRCPWPCNWWGWLCVGRVLTTGTQAPCGISACTILGLACPARAGDNMTCPARLTSVLSAVPVTPYCVRNDSIRRKLQLHLLVVNPNDDIVVSSPSYGFLRSTVLASAPSA